MWDCPPHALGYFSRAGKVTKSAPRGFTPGYPNGLICFALVLWLVLSKPDLLPCMRRSGYPNMSLHRWMRWGGVDWVRWLFLTILTASCRSVPLREG